ncbi:hypothetical protein DFA_03066 [Cavenderia fasciculata]|uniref:Uncharacterized protein n=1 Tax=Cavenderia fasciculata TaxID=261658 RepID=F4PGI7_CACFS|nr:uncharacterized protein DFA_03066 [Cavenderia fasciculata]EGG24821.1 hypothetical protein DFA_03066 [Cavenderia fasciculata]|eukprot:XP_004362672.1 hypothetical protein DFA_03066 [Cavenderia fasciculata]
MKMNNDNIEEEFNDKLNVKGEEVKDEDRVKEQQQEGTTSTEEKKEKEIIKENKRSNI